MQQNDGSLLSLFIFERGSGLKFDQNPELRLVSLIGLEHVSQHIIEPPALLISQIVELISEV